METRRLGRSGIEVSALGLGCWAIGGPSLVDGQPRGWGAVDDRESVRAIHRALELGVTFFDTADAYGAGHSEVVVGRALAGRRDRVTIATKFGNVFDERTKERGGSDASPDYIRRACEASLRRLGTDYIDLYQFHIGNYDPDEAVAVRDVLEGLVAAGKIRAYGWSTDDPARARVFAAGAGCTAIQQRFNLFEGNATTLAVCDEFDLASVNRGPLGQGLLTGKFTPDSTLPAEDVRAGWNLREGERAERLRRLGELREVLTADGRTLAQAALGWLWARSERTVPIPGFKTVAQVEENAGALALGPLPAAQMARLDDLLGR
jgi:aryl-alcohol dehydrogenase-like predicted oxidoreductase